MTLFFTDLNREGYRPTESKSWAESAIDSNEMFIEDLEVSDDDVDGEGDEASNTSSAD